jgi:hypothetical protein
MFGQHVVDRLGELAHRINVGLVVVIEPHDFEVGIFALK